MRVLITGSREMPGAVTWKFRTILLHETAILHPLESEYIIVDGRCQTGTDEMAYQFVQHMREKGDMRFVPERHPAQWMVMDKSGQVIRNRAAGPIRNKAMVDLGANVCLAFFVDGAKNAGTGHCVKTARAAGISTKTWTYDPKTELFFTTNLSDMTE